MVFQLEVSVLHAGFILATVCVWLFPGKEADEAAWCEGLGWDDTKLVCRDGCGCDSGYDVLVVDGILVYCILCKLKMERCCNEKETVDSMDSGDTDSRSFLLCQYPKEVYIYAGRQ